MSYSNHPQMIEHDEDTEFSENRAKFSSYPKLSKWFDFYFDSSNQQTFQNRTETALIAYDLDPNSPEDRKYAWELGSKNTRKCKEWAEKYYESRGMSKEKVLDLIAAKAVGTNNAKYLIMLAELTGVYEQKPTVAIQNNIKVNDTTQNVTEAEKKEFNRNFEDFISSRNNSAFISKNKIA